MADWLTVYLSVDYTLKSKSNQIHLSLNTLTLDFDNVAIIHVDYGERQEPVSHMVAGGEML